MIEKLYIRSPYILKCILISIYGLRKSRQRRRGAYAAALENAKAIRTKKKAWKSADREEVLKNFLSNAIKNVPAYSDYKLGDSDWHNYFKEWPVLTKKNLKERGEYYLNPTVKVSEYLSTTGSTGSPLSIPASVESRQINYAFFDDFLYMHGAYPRCKKITIAGRKIISSKYKGDKFWVYDFYNRNLYMSAYHLSQTNIEKYLIEISNFKPVFIDSYPSALYELAIYARQNKYKVYSPKFICTSSETLLPHQRALIEKVFQCPVRDQYGCAEMCIFGYECNEGTMHLRTDYAYVETSVENDCLPEGSLVEGDLICTGLINPAFPLIRYAIGDRGVVSVDFECKCGCPFPALNTLEGRKDDYVKSITGRLFTRLSPVLKNMPIHEAQFEQISPHELLVRIVPDRSFQDSDIEVIRNRVNDYTGFEFQVSIEFVNRIPRGAGGKFRAVIGLKGTV